ncbi:MAG: hypothetical protein M3Y59_08820 [Myxococcota bacterium]|nr:hypothetical protein [Myxococcota bacterium]
MKRADVARMRPLERKALLEEIAAMVASGELKLGEAARVLRSAVLGMDRQTFAQVVKLSPRAIAHLEDDAAANPTLETLTRVFAPFGGRPGLIFPGMEEAAPPDEERRKRRQSILGALASSKRARRAGG